MSGSDQLIISRSIQKQVTRGVYKCVPDPGISLYTRYCKWTLLYIINLFVVIYDFESSLQKDAQLRGFRVFRETGYSVGKTLTGYGTFWGNINYSIFRTDISRYRPGENIFFLRLEYWIFRPNIYLDIKDTQVSSLKL